MTKEKDYSYKEFSIAKKSGKTRKICNPSPDLKRWQRFQLKKLVKVFQRELPPRIADTFHGFLPNRNAVTAAAKHIPFQVTMMFDITDFFDSVTLLHINKVIALSDFSHHMRMFHKDGYTAQGFPTSPMLANIALIPVAEALDRMLAELFLDKYALTIYADDIQISFNNPDYSLQRDVIDRLTEIFEAHTLVINANKTRTKYEKFGARRILGVNVTNAGISPTRKTVRKLRAVRNQVKYSKEKRYVLSGLAMWATSPAPKGYGFML